MFVFLNGEIVPAERAVVSVFDRGFLYGDGLFETLRVFRGQPLLWTEHLERLHRGAEFLGIPLPYSAEWLCDQAVRLAACNELPDSLLRLTLSRGTGPRGYSPRGAGPPTLVMTMHAAPACDPAAPTRWRLATAGVRLPAETPLAAFKTCNKLPQILARAEAEQAGADEALLLNTNGQAIETSSGNLFWLDHGVVRTPPVTAGLLPGVTREVVRQLCAKLGLAVGESHVTADALFEMDAVFVSLASVGIAEGISLDGRPLRQSPEPGRIWRAYAARFFGD